MAAYRSDKASYTGRHMPVLPLTPRIISGSAGSAACQLPSGSLLSGRAWKMTYSWCHLLSVSPFSPCEWKITVRRRFRTGSKTPWWSRSVESRVPPLPALLFPLWGYVQYKCGPQCCRADLKSAPPALEPQLQGCFRSLYHVQNQVVSYLFRPFLYSWFRVYHGPGFVKSIRAGIR